MDLENNIEQYLKIRRRMKPSVDPRTCALLVIDMQEYQVREKEKKEIKKNYII